VIGSFRQTSVVQWWPVMAAEPMAESRKLLGSRESTDESCLPVEVWDEEDLRRQSARSLGMELVPPLSHRMSFRGRTILLLSLALVPLIAFGTLGPKISAHLGSAVNLDGGTMEQRGTEPCRRKLLHGSGLHTSGEDDPCKPPQDMSFFRDDADCSHVGQDCSQSKCCKGAGLRCYEKDSGFAMCKAECQAGPDPLDPDPSAWSCRPLGSRTPGLALPCAPPGESCTESRCCTEGGASCFAKNTTWSECRSTCAPGPDIFSEDTRPWSCQALGPKATSAAPWVEEQCAKGGKNCGKARCCAAAGAQCYEKDAGWSECVETCDSTWTCNKIGSRTPRAPEVSVAVRAVARWVGERCADLGEECGESRCCRNPGAQCFEKNASWATCKLSCIEGPDLADEDWHPWSCRPLGVQTPMQAVSMPDICAGEAEDCSKSLCCKQPGMRCYAKNEFWAECRANCGQSGFEESCKPLGDRTPEVWELPEAPFHWAPRVDAVPAWLAVQCAAAGEPCGASKCCMERGTQCYEKDARHASCRVDCTPGEHGWSCRKIGPRSPTSTTTTTTTTTSDTTTTVTSTSITATSTFTTMATSTVSTSTLTLTKSLSVFCFAVARSTGDEPDILKFQLEKKTGIFACTDYAVLSTERLSLGGGFEAISFETAQVGVSSDGTAGNSRLFHNAWAAIGKDGRYKQHDFTIKVDPDAILVPSRLGQHLASHIGKKVYFNNCDAFTPALYGAVEVFSQQALQAYFEDDAEDGIHLCRQWEWKPWGEDVFMSYCLKQLGVEAVDDFHLVRDERCKGVSCYDDWAAAFHPFKTLEQWSECWNVTANIEEKREKEQERKKREADELLLREKVLFEETERNQKLKAAQDAKEAQADRDRSRAAREEARKSSRERRAKEKSRRAAKEESLRRHTAKQQRLRARARGNSSSANESVATRSELQKHQAVQLAAVKKSELQKHQAAQLAAEVTDSTGSEEGITVTEAPWPPPPSPRPTNPREALQAALEARLKIGDKVRVRDSSSSRWMPGTVTCLKPLSVKPKGWKVGYSWFETTVLTQDRLMPGDRAMLAPGRLKKDGSLWPGDIGEVLARRPRLAGAAGGEEALLVRAPGDTSAGTPGKEWWYRESALAREQPSLDHRCIAYGCGSLGGVAKGFACDCDVGCIASGSCCEDFLDWCRTSVVPKEK